MATDREKSDADEILIRVRPGDAKTCRVDVDGVNVFRYAPRGGEGAGVRVTHGDVPYPPTGGAGADERAPGLTAEGERACAEEEEREARRLYGVWWSSSAFRFAWEGSSPDARSAWCAVARDVLARRVVVDAPDELPADLEKRADALRRTLYAASCLAGHDGLYSWEECPPGWRNAWLAVARAVPAVSPVDPADVEAWAQECRRAFMSAWSDSDPWDTWDRCGRVTQDGWRAVARLKFQAQGASDGDSDELQALRKALADAEERERAAERRTWDNASRADMWATQCGFAEDRERALIKAAAKHQEEMRAIREALGIAPDADPLTAIKARADMIRDIRHMANTLCAVQDARRQ